MKKAVITSLSILMLCSIGVFGQIQNTNKLVQPKSMISNLGIFQKGKSVENIPAHRTCGTVEAINRVIQQYPGYQSRLQDMENNIQRFLNNYQQNSKKTVITIPVVVHVVYKTGSQNISDAQIQSQIDVLNEDYRRLNSDASNTPGAFTGVAADAQIEFCLAAQDEFGNSTNGITRTSTSVNSWSTNDAVKYTSQGGKDGWDRNEYLNIWVCNLGGGLLGYALMPGGPASSDGVVIGYQYFGTIGTVSYPYNKGRTTTHEVGHWLGLYHIWADDGGGCSGSDQVSDTPNQGDYYYGCPSYPQNSCSSSDMFMNYMDYTNDACMNLFTQGQASRMTAVLNSTRASILSSAGCNVTAPPVTDFIANNTSVVVGSDVSFTDLTTGVPISWSWNFGGGGTPNTSTQQHPVITFNSIGIYTVSLTATNGMGNDTETKTSYIDVIAPTGCGSALFDENFEGVTIPTLPGGWSTSNSSGGDVFMSGDYTTANSAGSFPVTDHTQFVYANDDACQCNMAAVYLQMPTLNFTGIVGYSLLFDAFNENQLYGDASSVEVSTNGGSIWNLLYTIPAIPSGWQAFSINMSAYNNLPDVRIRFKYDDQGQWGGGIALDNVRIGQAYGNNLAVDSIRTGEYTLIPQKHTAPITFMGRVVNNGINPQTNVILTADVTGAGTFTGSSSTIPSMTPGNSSIMTITPNFTPLATGTYYVDLTATQDSTDCTLQDNTMSGGFLVTDTIYARDDGNGTGLFWGGAGNPYIMGNNFDLQTSDDLNSILGWVYGDYGDGLRFVVYNTSGGLPTTLVGSTSTYNLTASDTPSAVLTLQVTGAPLALSAGTYFIGVEAFNATGNIALVYSNNVFTPNSISASVNGGAFDFIENGGFNFVFIVRANFNGCTPPSVSVSPASPSYCAGGSTTLTASGANTYVWSPATGLSGTTGATVTASPTTTTTYTVVGTDGSGCTAQNTVTVTVNSIPTVTISPSTSICAGGSTILTASGASTYSWSPSTGLSSTTGSSVTASPSTNITYTVTGTSAGCTNSATVDVSIIANPTVSISPSSANICPGNNVTLTASGANFYSWSPSTGLDTISGISVNASPSTTTTYTVLGTATSGCSAESTVIITVSGGPSIDNETATNATSCSSNDGTITITASGGTPPLQYSINGGSTFSSSGIFTGLSPGSYPVVISDASGCITTGSVLIVSSAGTPSAPTAGTDASYCDGDAVADLTATGTNIEWFSDAGLTSSLGTGSPFAITPSVGTTPYYVTQTVSGCQSLASTIVITVNAIPSAPTAGTNATYCDGDAVADLTATGTGIEWFSDAGMTTLIGTGSPFAITPGVGTTTTYYVTQTVSGCQSLSSSVTISVNPVPIIDTESKTDATDCTSNDGAVTITASGGTPPLLYSIDGGANFSGSGTFTGLSTGNYPVVVSDANGCTVTGSTLNITAPGAPSAPTAGTNATYCQGDTMAELTATAGSGGTLTWYDDAGLTNVVGTGTTHTPDTTTGTTTYYVTETVSGCEGPPGSVVITIDDCTGIIETILASAIRLYPNPTTGTITLEFALDMPKDINITVMNILGEVVSIADVDNVTSEIYTIDLSGKANGIYFIRILTEEEVIVKKVSLVK